MILFFIIQLCFQLGATYKAVYLQVNFSLVMEIFLS